MNFQELTFGFYDYKKNFVKPTTMSTYRVNIENHILPYFGHMEEIKEVDLQSFVLSKLEKYSKHFVKDLVATIKSIQKYGVKIGAFNYPKYDIEWPTSSNIPVKKLKTLSFSEVGLLSSYIYDNFSFRNLGVLIAIQTGMRIGEVCGLKWSDVDIDMQSIGVNRSVQRITLKDKTEGKKTRVHIGTPKTHTSNRVIPIGGRLLELLCSMKKIANNDHYIVSNSNKPEEARTYRVYQKKLFKKIGLPEIRFHDIRHTFATLCIKKGVDVKTVSSLLGHSDVSITLNIYVHPSTEDKRNAITKVFC